VNGVANVPQALLGGKMWIRQQTKMKVVGAAAIVAVMSVCSIAAFSAISASSTSLRFPSETVGATSAPMPVTITNTSRQTVTIESVSVSQAQFSYSGPAFPITLADGNSFTASVKFSPTAAQTYTGELTFARNNGPKISVKLSGTGISTVTPALAVSLKASASALSFSGVAGGAAPAAQNLTIGDSPASALPFAVSADQAWITLSAASGTTSSAIQVGAKTSGLAAGNYSGHVIVSATGVTNAPLSIPVTLTVTAAPISLTASPSAMALSAVAGGTAPAAQSLTIGESPASALPFTVTADQVWMTLSAASGTTSSAIQVGANISGLAAGNYTGHVIVTAAGVTNSPMSVTVTLAVTAPQTSLLSVSPTSAAFGNINVGNNNTKSVTITNSGTSSVAISSVSVSGGGMSANGIATPMTLAAGQTTVLSVVFAPTVSGAVSGTVSVASNATNSPGVITTTGTGTQPQLSASPSTLNFGSVAVGSSGSQTITLSNTGTAAATISQAVISGTGYTMSGLALPTSLAAGASASFSVQFAPTVAGSDAGSVTVTSNTANSPTLVALNGSATAPVAHSVTLSWVASTSTTVVGYNIYRGSVSGGPYSKLNSTPNAGLTYTDSTVAAGQTYFYVVTAVDSSGNESVVSNEAAVTVPTP
jgi:hypothetical protein